MPLPAIIANNLLPVGALAPVAAPAGPPPGGAAAGGPAGQALPFTMLNQEQSNWCWSAVAISVSQFYNAASPWNSQCGLASAELGLPCCPVGNNQSCNVPHYLDQALTRTANYNTYGNVATFSQIQAEINAQRPLGVRIGWYLGGGHFVVITGYSNAGGIDYVTVDDPIGPSQSTLAYSTFLSQYLGSGAWTHSFWTQP